MSAALNIIANHEAERAVIAALIRKPDVHEMLRLGISDDLFSDPRTRAAFVAIAHLLVENTAPDAATLRAALNDASLIEVETSLAEHASAANLSAYVKLLKDCRRERERQSARQRLAQAVEAGAPEHELAAILESIRTAGTDESTSPRFQWAEDFCQNSEPEPDLIDGYIPANSLGVIFGDSEAYKSFLMIDLCGHIATGRQWRGRDVLQGKVAFIAGEGGSGLKARIQAWFEKHHEKNRNFAVSTVPLELCDPKNSDQLIADIQRFIGDQSFKFIVLDTLNTHFGAGDENTTADMTRFRLSALKLSQATGATVAIAHHCGLQDKNRSRGSISLHNGVDWEYKLERSGDCTTLTPTKMKDGPRPNPLSWHLVPQSLPWLTAKRDPINSAVLEPTESPIIVESASGRLPASQRIALDTLGTALMAHGVEDKGIVAVAEDQWRKAAYDGGISDGDSDAKKKAFRRARLDLIAKGRVCTHESRYWIPHPRTKRDKTEQCPPLSGALQPANEIGGQNGPKRDMSRNVPDSGGGQNGTHPYKGCPVSPCPPRVPMAEQESALLNVKVAAKLRGIENNQEPPLADPQQVVPKADGLLSHQSASNPPVAGKFREEIR